MKPPSERCRLALAVAAGALLLGALPARAQFDIAIWVVAGSDLDPFVQSGAPFVGESTLWLWLVCDGRDGSVSARMDLLGSFEILGFTPMNGVTNTGTFPALDLQLPACCPAGACGLFVAGTITVRDSTGAGGQICLGNSFAVSCTQQSAPLYTRGYTTEGAAACGALSCGVDIMSTSTWGRVKGAFRR